MNIIINISFLVTIILFTYVYRIKKIPMLSAYSLLFVYWAIYVVVPLYLVNYGDLGAAYFLMPMMYSDMNVVQTYILLNCLFLTVFSLTYLFTYKPPIKTKLEYTRTGQIALFLFLCVTLIPLMIVGAMFPYGPTRDWVIHSIMSNIRTVYVGVFIYYLFREKSILRVLIVFVLFCVFNFIEGTRQHLMMATLAMVFYYYDLKILNTKKIIAIGIAGFMLLSLIGIYRGRGGGSITLDPKRMVVSMFAEGVWASWPSMCVTKVWLDGNIQYYNYFTDYIIDPIILFVPQYVFRSSGEDNKGTFNILGIWENNHERYISDFSGSFTPQGGYHYMAQALSTFSVFGIILVAFLYALINIRLERNRFNSKYSALIYYIFMATFGVTFIRQRFSFSFRYFLQTLVMTFAMFFIVDIIRTVSSRKKRELPNESSV